jgi:hypothetical protein
MAFTKELEYSMELRPVYMHIIEVLCELDRNLEVAWEWSKEFEIRAEEHHDLRGLASAWWYQGDVFRRKGGLKNAVSLHQKGLDMFERIGDDKHACDCHANMSSILLRLGNVEEASVHSQSSLTTAEQLDRSLMSLLRMSLRRRQLTHRGIG